MPTHRCMCAWVSNFAVKTPNNPSPNPPSARFPRWCTWYTNTTHTHPYASADSVLYVYTMYHSLGTMAFTCMYIFWRFTYVCTRGAVRRWVVLLAQVVVFSFSCFDHPHRDSSTNTLYNMGLKRVARGKNSAMWESPALCSCIIIGSSHLSRIPAFDTSLCKNNGMNIRIFSPISPK